MTARSNSFAIVVLSTLVVAIAIIAWSVAADRSHSGPNAVALAAGSGVPDATPATTDSPRPSSTLTTLRDAEGVGAIALAHIESMAETGRAMGLDGADERTQIRSVVAASWSDLHELEPNAGALDLESPDSSRVVWVVRADGPFAVLRTPRGREPFVGASGYLVIDDESGMILGMGTP